MRCRNLLCLFALMTRKQNPINDIINTVGGWLGGRGPGTNPQVQAAMNATRAVGKVVDTATGGFGSALLSDAQRMAQTGSSTPSALYKTAAVNLGAAAAGVGAAKVAGKVVQSGRAAVKGTYFGVHGSTVKNLPEIQPRMGVFSSRTNRAAKSAGYNVPDAPVVYSYPATADRVSSQANSAQSFARNGSIYVVKSPANKVSAPQWNPVERMSSEPMKVIKEIKLGDLSNSAKQVKQSTEDAITSARAARDLNLAQQVAKAVKKEKVKTFIKGAIRPR